MSEDRRDRPDRCGDPDRRDQPDHRDRPFGRPHVEAPTSAQAAWQDRASILDGVAGAALMENAGRQAAMIVHRLFPEGRVVALVGSGNNGGDGLVCLRALAAWGRPVAAVVVGNRPRRDPVLHGWELPCRFGWEGEDALAEASVVVDGLLGTGIRGAPQGPYAEAIEALNRSPAPVVALDAPSGVDGATGRVPGAAVRAEVTVAFGWPKLGTLLYPGRERSGRIVAVEIGFPPRDGDSGGRSGGAGHWARHDDRRTDDDRPGHDRDGRAGRWARLLTPGWASRTLPRRSPCTHKNAVGALTVVAGSAMPGAAALAVRSAFRCGVGLVRTCGTELLGELLPAVPEALYVDAGDREALGRAVEACRALVVGPGLGTDEAARRQLGAALAARGERPVVVDADALTLLARGEAGGMNGLAGGPAVVTPHPGEMARLLGCAVEDVQGDRVAAARGLAEQHEVVVLLKGAPSLVAAPGGQLLVATVQETSALAVAGMGDVLAGATGAFLAQGVGAADAAGLALEVTGRAASARGLGAALTPSDVVDAVRSALARRGDGATDLPFPFVTFDQDPPR